MYKKIIPPVLVVLVCFFILIFITLSCDNKKGSEKSKEKWLSLFNEKDLTGWDIKIAGQTLNDNYKNTFRVEDSMLRVAYDQYEKFDNKFGHIYYKEPFSYYKLKFEYRFVGNYLPDAPEWGKLNSGIMIHSQSAESINIDQGFPVSVECQFLGGSGEGETPTGNVCTPGTQIYMNGSLQTDHCISSTSKTYHGEQWVAGIIEVYGDSLVRHIINDDTVLTYTNLQIGGGFVNQTLNWTSGNISDSLFWIKKDGTPLTEGYIALQAESQPIDFRRIELLNLVGCMDPAAKNYKNYYVKADNSKCKY